MAWTYYLDMGIYVNWTEPANNRSRVTWYVNVYGEGVYYSDYVTRGSITIQCRNNGVGSGAYFLHDNGTNLGTSWTPWSTWNGKTSMAGASYWNTLYSGSLWLYHGTRGYVEMIASGNFESDSYYGTPYMEDGGWWQTPNNGGGLTDFDRSPTTPTTPTVTRLSSGSGISGISYSGGVNNSGPAVSYEQRYSVNSDMSAYGTFSGTSVSLTPTSAYYFNVYASNEDGNKTSGTSSIVYGVPSAPTSPSATRSTTVAGRIDLGWTAPSNTQGGITGYNIYRKLSTDALFPTTATYQLGNVTSYNDTTSLVRGNTYNYKIVAKNAVGFNDNTLYSTSSTVSEMAPGVPSAPSSITSPIENSALKVGRNVTIQYAADSNLYGNSLVGYYMQFSTDNGATWHGWDNTTKTKITNGENAVTGGAFTYQLLTPALTYKWRVYAKNTIGTGDLTRVTPTGTFVGAGGKVRDGAAGPGWNPAQTAKRYGIEGPGLDQTVKFWDLKIAKKYDQTINNGAGGWVDLS